MARFHLITRAFRIFPVLRYCSPQWSVSTVNVLPYRYLFNFCIPHTMAKHSCSSTEYFLSLSLSFLLIYDTGCIIPFSSCNSTHPMAKSEASVLQREIFLQVRKLQF